MFRKQPKQTKDQPKQRQICLNINQIAHTMNSVCFGCFDTYPKHQNKLKNFILGFVNKQKNNRNRLSFGLFRFVLKKMTCFKDTLIESVFGDFFGLFGLFRKSSFCFGCFDTNPKHRNKPKTFFWFRETNRKTT